MGSLHNEPVHYHQFVAPQKILVATDLDDADYLIPHAVAQARASGATVILAHIVPPFGEALSLDPGAVSPIDAQSMEHEASATLNSIAAGVRSGGVPCDLALRHGFPRDQIAGIIGETGAGRVLAGTHGRRRLGKFFLGSVAEEILCSSTVPVFLVGPRARATRSAGPPSRILHIVHFYPGYEAVVSIALDLARFYGANISLLCVRGRRGEADRHATAAFDRAKQQLQEMCSAATPPHVRADITAVYGNVTQQALSAASEIGADLIVLGAYPSRSFRPDHSAYRIMCEAQSPVLSIQPCR